MYEYSNITIATPIFTNQQRAAEMASIKSNIKGSITLAQERIAASKSLGIHSDTVKAGNKAYPLVYTGDNHVSIAGTWEDYRIVVRSPDRTQGCEFHSNVGKIDCSL